jgi:hypothetical protein
VFLKRRKATKKGGSIDKRLIPIYSRFNLVRWQTKLRLLLVIQRYVRSVKLYSIVIVKLKKLKTKREMNSKSGNVNSVTLKTKLIWRKKRNQKIKRLII